MSHQERTWVETKDEATGLPRWNVLINGTPVPGGYVLQTAESSFEVHYPHVETFSKPSLAEAKERVEWAPPITLGSLRIAREAADDASDSFLDPEQAGELLGVSRYRVNAMVANGRLAARRAADGSRLVSRASVQALLDEQAAAAGAASAPDRE